MTTSVRLAVEGIAVKCTIGVSERERQTRQEIVVNVEFYVQLDRAHFADSLDETVDYRTISQRVIEEASRSTFLLIESLAMHLAQTLLAEFPRMHEVRVDVLKPGALSAAGKVGVTVISQRTVAGNADGDR